MKNINLAEVKEAQDFQKVTPGGYVCRITAVEDRPEKEYLFIEYDIVDGDFKDYYKDLYASQGFWGGKFVKSYKEKALPFFKAFITAVESSNQGYHWDNDEDKLVGKFVGLVLAEEEYIGNDGTVKVRLYVDRPRSIAEIKAGNFEVPSLKKLSAAPTNNSFPVINETSDLPF